MEGQMELVVSIFREARTAARSWEELRSSPAACGDLLDHAAVVARTEERTFEVAVGYRVAPDRASWTMLWPFLFAMTFFVPVLEMAYGPGMGAVMGAIEHTSLDAQVQRRIRDMVRPGTSAIFVMAGSHAVIRIVSALEDAGGTVTRVHLTREDERQLREAVFGRAA
jgi:uncharacterized membrane protein